MILALDTSYKYLCITLIENNEIIDAIDLESFKKQSELIMLKLDELFKKNNKKPQDISEVVVSKGPGSYTGIRIAMVVAKMIATQLNIPLKTISTLKLYANNEAKTAVIMDARSKRCYFGVYDKGECLVEDQIIEISDLASYSEYNFVGDLSLIDETNNFRPVSQCFLNNLNQLELVTDSHKLTPSYLKKYE